MRRTENHTQWEVVVAALICVGLAPGLFARQPDQPSQAISVIAHLPLQGPPAHQMYLQANGVKRYLYVDQGRDQGYSVVDISNPAQPSVVKHVDSGQIQVVGSNVALAETPEHGKTLARSHATTESVTVMDTSNPANPKTVQTFRGVTSVLEDDSRDLIFLTNDEGLWILQEPAATMRPARKKKPPCDSEAAISSVPPDCQ